MRVTCQDCGRAHDDEKQWTVCPHNPLDVGCEQSAFCWKCDLRAPCACPGGIPTPIHPAQIETGLVLPCASPGCPVPAYLWINFHGVMVMPGAMVTFGGNKRTSQEVVKAAMLPNGNVACTAIRAAVCPKHGRSVLGILKPMEFSIGGQTRADLETEVEEKTKILASLGGKVRC